MKNAEKKTNKSKLAVRIMAWILAGLMVVTATYFTAAMIVNTIRENNKTEQTEQTDKK